MYEDSSNQWPSVCVQIIHTEDATVAQATLWSGEDYFTAKGSSRRDPADVDNREVGIKLALGRALRQLGREILKDGNNLVRQEDIKRKTQQAATEARKAESANATMKAKRKVESDTISVEEINKAVVESAKRRQARRVAS